MYLDLIKVWNYLDPFRLWLIAIFARILLLLLVEVEGKMLNTAFLADRLCEWPIQSYHNGKIFATKHWQS